MSFWRQYIANRLARGPHALSAQLQFEQLEHVECDACRAKDGAPDLCVGCLANRHTINELRRRVGLDPIPAT